MRACASDLEKLARHNVLTGSGSTTAQDASTGVEGDVTGALEHQERGSAQQQERNPQEK